ncbi:DUF397 domain-containing protein [Streptomyces sanyensis]|uniref:DUF397 domain-containing protein n=1 Tax=Streptomyces sanyensis TaxID=568869 RepID=UPI003D788CA7
MTRNASAEGPGGLVWFTSSYSSGPEGDSCVEVADGRGAVHVRDSKDLDGPRLALTRSAWAGFVAYAASR